MRLNKSAKIKGFFLSRVPVSNLDPYPEYPGAALTEAILTYSSVVDPTKTNLKVRIYFPTWKTNLPLWSGIHGFDQIATDLSEDLCRRTARTGKFVAAFELRGSAGSGGTVTFTNDAGGRQKFDVRDGEDYIETLYGPSGSIAPGTLAYNAGVMRREIYSQSFGGTVSIGMAISFPDRYVNVTAYFPVVNCITWDTWLRANGGTTRSDALRSYIGDTPAALPDEWASRNGNIVSNILSEIYFAADTADASVEVAESQNLATALLSAGKTYTYNESTVGSPYRWSHGNPDTFPDLLQLEPLWKNKVKTGSIRSIARSGLLYVRGHLETRDIFCAMSDGNLNNSGRCRTGELTYDLDANTWSLKNTSSLYCVAVLKDKRTGYIQSQVIAAGATVSFTLVAQTMVGYALGMRHKVHASRVLKDGSNNVQVFCDSTGGWANQGYSVRQNTGASQPLYVASAQNSLPAIRFSGSLYMQGELIKCMQGRSKMTRITVSTGVIISHGANANENTQIALVTSTYFGVIANGAGSNGSYSGTNACMARFEIFDGTTGTNILRYVIREKKTGKTLSFTSTIPATTESNASSVFTIGKRAYDATFFLGDLEDTMIIPDVALSTAECDAAADILDAEYNL